MSEKLIDGKALHRLRLQAGMTAAGLAAMATYTGKNGEEKHVSVSTILSYESGRRHKVSETTLMGLAHALKMDIFELEKALALDSHVNAPKTSEAAPDA